MFNRPSFHASLAAGWLAMISFALPAHAGEAAYAGESTDPVTGYHCVTPFCDTVVLPDSNCLCQKLNPDESRLSNLRLACTDMTTREQCTAPALQIDRSRRPARR